MKKVCFTVLAVLFIDQLLKIWIKTHMYLGQEFHVFGDWFIIHFTENIGMAFGMEFAGDYGKLLLSVFRIIAIGAIFWYVAILAKQRVKTGLLISIAFILAGAIGNMIDSAFYGLIFNHSFFQIASLFPSEGGYGTLLHGSVVDMLYFPIVSGVFPNWIPLWGGQEFEFFRPVFNIADASITTGVAMMIVFQKRYFKDGKPIKQFEEPVEDIALEKNI